MSPLKIKMLMDAYTLGNGCFDVADISDAHKEAFDKFCNRGLINPKSFMTTVAGTDLARNIQDTADDILSAFGYESPEEKEALDNIERKMAAWSTPAACWPEPGTLPPVGDRCEWHPTGSSKAPWKFCELLWTDGINHLVKNEASHKTFQILHGVRFRPIQSAADKERERAIEAMVVATGIEGDRALKEEIAPEWMANLYDAGYRKVEL